MKNATFWENILNQIQDIGVTKFARQSGISLANLEMWSYTHRLPCLSSALGVCKALGVDMGVSSVEEFVRLIKKYGVTKTARDSGVSVCTIRHWVYNGVDPLIDKVITVLNTIKNKE